MAPIRRYLRISKYSVLECRIFLENPADGPRWLLNPQDPALPRVFEAIRPLVLPKLREENERAKGKGKKKKVVKDVVQQDDFEASVFLMEIETRHSLLVKSKTFRKDRVTNHHDSDPGSRNETPFVIDEDSDGDHVNFDPIPSVESDLSDSEEPRAKRVKQTHADAEVQPDDKKKLGLRTSYDGFTIWGWVLCLLVDRKGGPGKKRGDENGPTQVLMQEWITSTQEQDEG